MSGFGLKLLLAWTDHGIIDDDIHPWVDAANYFTWFARSLVGRKQANFQFRLALLAKMSYLNQERTHDPLSSVAGTKPDRLTPTT